MNSDWVFFTSQNGVSEFAAFLERTGNDSRIFGKAMICAIGSETAKSLRGIGITADYVPSEFVAEAVVKHFKKIAFGDNFLPACRRISRFSVVSRHLYTFLYHKKICLRQMTLTYF